MTSDLLLAGGRVYTGEVDYSEPGAVLVRDGLIAAVGPAEELTRQARPGFAVVDVGGGLVSAGFQDAHCHPVMAGAQLLTVDLAGSDDVTRYLPIIAGYAEAHSDEPWILGGGWGFPAFAPGGPTRQVLDAIVPDRPVYLINRDAHGAWVNSAALRLAGVDRHTPDPVDGRIERGPDGEPSGTLHEGATSLVTRHLPPPDPDAGYRALLAAQERMLALGITAWQDAIIGEYLGQPDTAVAYAQAAGRGTLQCDVIGSLWWRREAGTEQIDELLARRESLSVGRFRASTVKMMLDGIAENFTASMVEPYLDRCGHPTSNRGVDFIDPHLLPEYVTRLDALGFQVHFHALGDGAVRFALDALEHAAAANGLGRRHHLAHLQVVHPDDLGRFAAVDATANLQAFWAAHEPQLDELVIPFLGPEREVLQYPFAALAALGTRLAAGSDWPVTTPDPLAAIHTAVNRVQPDSDLPPLYPQQALSLPSMWRAYTSGSAYLNRREQVSGRLAPGLRADLAVLDRDPFTGPVTEIAAARVTHTLIDGAVVSGN